MNYIIDMDKMAMSSKALKLLLAGLLVMVAGYILMISGTPEDPAVFNYAMFDFRRLVAAPVVILAGIVTIVVAIVGNFKDKKEE